MFHALQTLVLSPQEYVEIGKLKGVLKEFRFSIRDLKCVEVSTMSAIDYAAMGDWEG